MDETSDVAKCVSAEDWKESNIQRFSWRLNLVYCYKIYFDPTAKFARAQIDFINGFMSRDQMHAIACRYYSLITDAVEFAENTQERIRNERLGAASGKYLIQG